VPGNHCLWLTTTDKSKGLVTSVDKFNALLQLCKEVGVHTEPKRVGTRKPVWIVPLFSWYHESFDDDPATKGEKIEAWNDFALWYDVVAFVLHIANWLCFLVYGLLSWSLGPFPRVAQLAALGSIFSRLTRLE